MWFKKEDDLRLPKLPPSKREKGVLDVFRKSFKKVEIPKYQEEPDILRKVDLGQKTKKIEPEFYFWLCDGRIIKDLKELTRVMRDMREDVFNFHVTDYRNDFSNWIRDVVKNEKLADKISRTKTREQAYEILSGKKLKKKKPRKRKLELESPEPQKIEKIGKVEEEKEERPEPQELGELEALKAEEEALEKVEEIIEHPEALLPYEGKIIPKPKKEKKVVKRPVKVKKIEEIKKKVKKPRLKGVDKINEILEEAEHFVNQGDGVSARSLTDKARPLLKRASMPKEEKKKLNYKIIDIEAKAKLIMLS